jgi:hypothetical protein
MIGLHDPGFVGSLLTPAQALINAWRSRGMTGILLPTAQYYNAPLSAPGVLTDAINPANPYTAASAAGTPLWVNDGSGPKGVPYLSANGMNQTLIGAEAETCACYCAVFWSPAATWSSYGGVLEDSSGTNTPPYSNRIGNFSFGATSYDSNGSPRFVRRNGVLLSAPFALAPITTPMIVTVSARNVASMILEMCMVADSYSLQLRLAALGKWSADPTSAQITGAESDASIYTGIAV